MISMMISAFLRRISLVFEIYSVDVLARRTPRTEFAWLFSLSNPPWPWAPVHSSCPLLFAFTE